MEKNGVPMPQILTWPPISGSIWAPERALGSRGYLVNPSGLGRVNSGIHNSVHIQLVLEARRSFNCLHKNVSCSGSCWGDRSTSLKAQEERRPRSMLPGRVMEINKRRCCVDSQLRICKGPRLLLRTQYRKWHGFCSLSLSTAGNGWKGASDCQGLFSKGHSFHICEYS